MNDDLKDELETLQCVYGNEITVQYQRKEIRILYVAALEINTKITVEFSITNNGCTISIRNHSDTAKLIPSDILSQIKDLLLLKYNEEIDSMAIFQCISFCNNELLSDQRLHLDEQLTRIKIKEDNDALILAEVDKYRKAFRKNGGSSIAYVHTEHNIMQFKQDEYKTINIAVELPKELRQIVSENKHLRDALPSPDTVHSWLERHLFVSQIDIKFIANLKNVKRFLLNGGKSKNFAVVFHGTSWRNDESIINNGLVVGGTKGVAITNGAACGHGVYCSPEINTANGYANGSLFVCLVRREACKTSGSIYVVPNDNDILPIYLITVGAYGESGLGLTGHAFLKRMKWMIQTHKKNINKKKKLHEMNNKKTTPKIIQLKKNKRSQLKTTNCITKTQI
eukprot:915942_1